MKKHKFADGGIYTAEMGNPPMEPDGGSARPLPKRGMPMKKPMPRKPLMPVAPKPRLPGMAADESAMPAMPAGMPGMKSGGSVGSASRRGDGCASKGKTKGTMVAMKGGGYAC